MKMTPSGTRTCLTSSPLGRRLDATVSPIGSGSAATSRKRLGHLVDPPGIQHQAVDRRGVQALRRARPATSRALAARISSRRSSKAAAEPHQPGILGRPVRHRQVPRGELGFLSQCAAKAQRDHAARFVALVNLQRPCSWRIPPTPQSGPDLDRVDHRADIMHPHDPRTRPSTPPVTKRPTPTPARATGRPVILPRNPLRDVPIRTTHPRFSNRRRLRKISRLCCVCLAEPDPRIDGDPLAGDSVGHGPLDSPRQEVVNFGHDVVVMRGSCCMVAGVPCMCMRTTPAPVSAATRAISGSAPARRCR